jgi:hypothetical protein
LGGAGGGAIQLTAGYSLGIGPTGAIIANGSGGQGGGRTSGTYSPKGGGGGGSGGTIILESAFVFADKARLLANGGGGGEGSGWANSPGANGADGDKVYGLLGAPGGSGMSGNGGNGGNGGARFSAPGAGQNGWRYDDGNSNFWESAGGGGGGAAGALRIRITTPLGRCIFPDDVKFSPHMTTNSADNCYQ